MALFNPSIALLYMRDKLPNYLNIINVKDMTYGKNQINIVYSHKVKSQLQDQLTWNIKLPL